MPASDAHPPMPGPIVQPNLLAVMEAVSSVTFPISKRELIERVGEGTVLFGGRNVDLHDLIKEVHDDYFDNEEELREAIERHWALPDEEAFDVTTTPQRAGAVGSLERSPSTGPDEPRP